ncbi:FAD-dependent oxidoreductase [Methylobacterium mesophilicum SR1.6/6]|uniref:FAD-dependent oxidoreductase n=1 Tax=Methylobacterium mesophilicum SR1.6/6 TaxID=908290 RepID=A0A6B9FGA6_9HYPH|nr:FAD-dependent tricarballylate dehydrogenase TcuA [Methylobacterium mesophilicum]QGY01841.1 FAD-dependent oxidoreductase [Methylobacterium mesophilicum SR1.6/6]
MKDHQYDVVVVGCGVAGLSAAVSAAETGRRVAVLERSPIEERGGNTRWTEAYMRMKNENEVSDDFEEHFMQNAGSHLDPSLVAETGRPYPEWSPIVKALSFTDPEIVSTLATEAGPTLAWLREAGVTFSDMASYLITSSTTRICPVGGGLALIEALASAAERRGVDFYYQTSARALVRGPDGAVAGIEARNPDGAHRFHGKVVLACGGFEGNAEMQVRYYGAQARYIRPVARGGYYNRGEGIRMGLDAGAAPCGDFSEYHAEPIDPRSGQSEPIVFVFPYGILVDGAGRRFVDEASHTVDAIYENIARMIARLPGGTAYVVCDARLDDVPNWQRTVRSDQKPYTADTIEDLARQIGVPPAALAATVAAYNAATRPGQYRPLELDGLSTEGLTPPKSNWALPIDLGPYRAWPISSANCFTFGGLRCNTNAQVVDHDGEPIDNLYAAGETMGLYYGRYTGATSVLRGAVFGRIAGRHAAQANHGG